MALLRCVIVSANSLSSRVQIDLLANHHCKCIRRSAPIYVGTFHFASELTKWKTIWKTKRNPVGTACVQCTDNDVAIVAALLIRIRTLCLVAIACIRCIQHLIWCVRYLWWTCTLIGRYLNWLRDFCFNWKKVIHYFVVSERFWLEQCGTICGSVVDIITRWLINSILSWFQLIIQTHNTRKCPHINFVVNRMWISQ